MAQTISVSQKELQRVANSCYEGQTLKIMLCSSSLGFDAQTSVSSWQSVEIVGNGYVRGSVVIGNGSYSTVSNAYALPTVTASFTATGAGYSYNTVVFYIQGSSFPHSICTESPNVVISAGQTQTYSIDLLTDD